MHIKSTIMRLAIAALIADFIVPVPLVFASPQWRQFRRDNFRSAATSEEIRTIGSALWSKEFTEFPHENAHIILADNIALYSLMDGTIRAFNATANTYQELWSVNTGASLNNAPAAYDGKVYLVNIHGRVMALSAQTGQTLWEYTVPTDVSSPPLYVNGRIYFGGINGIVYCFDAVNGGSGPIWTFATPYGMIDTALVYHNGKIIFDSENMKAYALDWKTGAKIWETAIAGDKTWNGSPVIAKDANRVVFQTLSTYLSTENQGSTYRDVCNTCPGKYDVGPDATTDWNALHAFDTFISANRPAVNTNVVLDTETGTEIRNFSFGGQAVSLIPFTSMYWNSIRWSIWNNAYLYAEANRRSWLVNLKTGVITSPKWYTGSNGYFVRGDENVLTILSGNRVVGGIRKNLAAFDISTNVRTQLQGDYANESSDATHIQARTFSTPHYETHPGDGYTGENSELIPYHNRVFYMDNGWLYAFTSSITDINPDSQAPTKPTGVTANPLADQSLDIIWAAATDNLGVIGYRVYRDNQQIATTNATEYIDASAVAGTHTYQITSLDAQENESIKSDIVSATKVGSGPTATLTQSVTMTQTTKPGDSNNDGKVDGLDYIAWLTHFGQNITGSSVGDFNNNGKVDGLDYIVWLNSFGK